MSEQDEQQLLQQIKQHLDASADNLDATTRSRLTQIRHQVLEANTKQKRAWQIPAVALASTAAVALVAVSLQWQPPGVQQATLEDLPLLTASESFELIDDVEFYEWLMEEIQHG